MYLALYIYGSLTAFILLSIYKFYLYSRFPLPSRWELYPVPGEGSRFSYGGSYYEDSMWWKKPRKVRRLRVMAEVIKEMFFIKRLFANLRPLWRLSYCMHLGIYSLAVFTLLVLLGSVLPSFSDANRGVFAGKISYYVNLLTCFWGMGGMFLLALGSGGLFLKRLFDPSLRRYSVPLDYVHLLFLFSAAVTGLIAWGKGPGFAANLDRVKLLLVFSPVKVSGLMTLHVLLLGFLLVYIPVSKMSHYVSKYYSYHRVLWDNEPNLPGSKIERKVKENLGSRPDVTWLAPHASPEWLKEKK